MMAVQLWNSIIAAIIKAPLDLRMLCDAVTGYFRVEYKITNVKP